MKENSGEVSFLSQVSCSVPLGCSKEAKLQDTSVTLHGFRFVSMGLWVIPKPSPLKWNQIAVSESPRSLRPFSAGKISHERTANCTGFFAYSAFWCKWLSSCQYRLQIQFMNDWMIVRYPVVLLLRNLTTQVYWKRMLFHPFTHLGFLFFHSSISEFRSSSSNVQLES